MTNRMRTLFIGTAAIAVLLVAGSPVYAENAITHVQFNVTTEKCDSFPIDEGTVTVCFTGHSVYHEVEQPDGDFTITRSTDTITSATLDGEFYAFDDFRDHSHVAFQAGELRE